MVSIRRRKLLGLRSGRDSFMAPHTQVIEHGQASQDRVDNVKLENTLVTGAGSSFPSTPNEHINQQHPEVKRRKKHRRKFVENQEPCVMRGVYFKNMKWQAAIKVDKKQIHLGTVGSQEEAARLYDRAAFMCGREPNFELSEEDRKELRKFNWDEFLAMTRSAINNKKSQRRMGPGNKTGTREGNWDGEGNNGFSASEEGGLAP